MAKVTIGTTDYTVSELNFVALERSWPSIERCMITLDPMEAVSTAIRIIANGLQQGDHFIPGDYGIGEELLDEEQIVDRMVMFLKRKLLASQMGNIRLVILEILQEAGIEAKENPQVDPPEVVENPSPETAPDTSQNLSQPGVKEEAGTV